jgi:anti-sigma factor RsiW
VKPIEPAELSAYMDGELDPARAREVEGALESSPALRAEFNSLVSADNSWRMAARTASFRPGIRLQPTDAPLPLRSVFRAAGFVILLLAARVVPKLASTLEVELILNAVALTIALTWIVRMTRADIHEQSV